MARVSTYLNFPGSTEEAFHFYAKVFNCPLNPDIARFGDGPQDPSRPMSESDKQLILHIELPLIHLGGHVLMGTDAPESMGFSVRSGNQVHINLEPDTRAEAERLFNGLADGGQIGMPLQDMFWGAYFGSVTDRFGVQWMVNCANTG